jgi:benzoylformate decarboxylase
MAIMAANKAIVELLRGEGVEYVFGIPGATEILFMDALESAADIHYILGLHEVVCAGMAEGYARASGKVGFLNLHTTPGVAAALPMLYNAWYGGVPLVVTAGQNHTRLLQYDPHLSGDTVGMGRIYTKWSTEVNHGEDIPVVLQRAFKMAMQPPTGPVLVSMPQNVLAQKIDFEYRANTVIYPRLRPDKAALEAALKILREAKNPALLVESGITRCHALDEVVRFAELTGVPVYQAWMSDVNFPVNHPQYLGDMDPSSPSARDLLRNVDVLVTAGCSLFAQGFYSPTPILSRHTKIIQIDENPWEIGKNMPVTCGIQADIKAALTELNDMLTNEMSSKERQEAQIRIKKIAEAKAHLDDEFKAQVENERDRTPMAISQLMTQINKSISPDTVIVDECWSSSAILRKAIEMSRPKSFFRARKGGSIGWGLPGALGVKLGLPHKPVIALSGDGSAAWSMQSFWTAAHYRIPVTFIIMNNGTYRQVKLVRKAVLGNFPLNERHLGMDIDNPVIDFTALARSMGVVGEAVSDPASLPGALKAAIDSGAPRVIEVFVENEP